VPKVKKRRGKVYHWVPPPKSKKAKIPRHIIRYGQKYTLMGKYATLVQADREAERKGLKIYAQVIFDKGVTKYIVYGSKIKRR